MAWQDRPYNRGGDFRGDEFLSNPMAILGLSVPFGHFGGARIRLHFWFILTFVFCLTQVFHGVPIMIIGYVLALFFAAVLMHEVGHRLFAGWVGGSHDEFVLWPSGGMVPPRLPPGPWPMFAGNVGGMAMNLALAGACCLIAGLGWNVWTVWRTFSLNPLSGFANPLLSWPFISGIPFFLSLLFAFAWLNWAVLMINVLPYFWFDGGYLLQSILWPFAGHARALYLTCVIGMLLAAPMFIWALVNESLIEMLFWAFAFSSAYTSRRSSNPFGGSGDWDDAIAMSAQNAGPVRESKRAWMKRGMPLSMAQQAKAARAEREAIDKILEKVSRKGMHSLNWFEKRKLRKATERQRRDEAARGY